MPEILDSAAAVETFWSDARLAVKRVRQQKDWFCGAACSEMVFSFFGKSISQEAAYNAIHNEDRFTKELMYSDPAGIVSYINANNDDLQMLDTMEVSKEDVAIVLDAIFRAIYGGHFPVVALVQNGGHWIVVSGVRYSHTLEKTQLYSGVYVENPWRDSQPGVYIAMNEFTARWLTPNQYGVTWKDRLVILTDKRDQIRSANMYLTASDREFTTASLEGFTSSRISSSLSAHGFDKVGSIEGGGATVRRPVEVIDEDTRSGFTIFPMDFLKEQSFKNFVYVSIENSTGDLLEIMPMSDELNIPDDAEVMMAARLHYQGATISVDPKYYWRRSADIKFRIDVYRKLEVNGAPYFMLRDGRFTKELVDRRPFGG